MPQRRINEEKRNYYMLKCREGAGNRLGSKELAVKEFRTQASSADVKNSKNFFFKWPSTVPTRKTLEWVTKGSQETLTAALNKALDVSAR
jgi:hypothetical protein